jgi:AcrR family transcriptional regulator
MTLSNRRAQGVATRQRIIEAAYRLMSERGYRETTMGDVAADAGVAVQTVYFSFQNKVKLFAGAWEYAVYGGHEPVPPMEQPAFVQLRQTDDLKSALELALAGSLEIYRRITGLALAFEGLSAEPEMRELARVDGELRREGYGHLLRELLRIHPLRAGLSEDDAAVILAAMMSGDTYRSMIVRLGWDEPSWRRWTIRTVAENLFAVSLESSK